ncbi:MAG: orotate phosphoribosyltransferase [Pseudonocardiaceae bacterium]
MTVPSSLVVRIRRAARHQGAFHLPDGQVLDEYFDQYLLAADPALLHDVAAEMHRRMHPDTEVLVGLELGGVPLAVALSAASGLPAGFLRREAKPYGTFRQLEGHPVEGRRVAMVDDVVRSGAQALRAAALLRRLGADVTTALCVLDRNLGGAPRLSGERIALRSLLDAADLTSGSLVEPTDAWRPVTG